MKIRSWKQIAALIVLGATIAFFAYYLMHNPEVGKRLKETPSAALAIIMLLYIGSVGSIALITIATLKMCDIKMDRDESIKLTAYSSLVNFFGPLQSGPAFRAIYLKRKHKINLKKYAAATLLYYLFFGMLGLIFVGSYWLDWRLGALVAVGLVALYMLTKTRSFKNKMVPVNTSGWYLLAFSTLTQVVIMTAIYFVELKTLAPATTLQQAVIYSGAANLALFVSLTPGAIGFRESFLIFSQNLHGIDNDTIIAASLLDRLMYVILLSVLAIGIFATHTKQALTAGIDDKDQ